MTGTGRRNEGSTARTDGATRDARDELKRTLERDTAVQGEREEDGAASEHGPGGADEAATAARPAPPGRKRTK